MRKLSLFLTLTLCLELILLPLRTSILAPGISLATSCPAGLSFDATLNRCLTSQEASIVFKNTQNCKGDKDCYKKTAADALGRAKAEGEVEDLKKINDWGAGASKGLSMATALLLTASIKELKSSPCSAISYGLFVAGAVATVAGDLIINSAHKKRLKNIKESWGKAIASNGENPDLAREASMSIQSEAFQKLADSEFSHARAAREKKSLYWTATGLFAAAGVVAGIEAMKGLGICKGKSGGETSGGTTGTTTQTPATPEPAPTPAVGAPSGNRSINPTNLNNPGSTQQFDYETPEEIERLFLDNHGVQLHHNLQNSQNLASLMMNWKALTEGTTPSVEEFEQTQQSLNGIEIDETGLAMVKFALLSVAKNLSPLSSAHANDTKTAFDENWKTFDNTEAWFVGGGMALGALAFIKPIKKKINKLMTTPITRIVLGGVLGGAYGFLADHASNVEKESEARGNKLVAMKEDFDAASNAILTCKSSDRNDTSKPNCYCYTADNQRNLARANTSVCQKIWGRTATPLKGSQMSDTGRKICITNQYNPDPTCLCKKSNSCLKAGVNGLTGINPGSFSMLNSAFDPLNQFANGNIAAGNFGAFNPQNNALRMMDALKKVTNSPAIKKHKDLLTGQQKELEKMVSQAAGTAGASFNTPNSSPLPTNPGEAARMLEKELEDKTPTSISGDQQPLAAPSQNAGDDSFNFDLGGDQSSPETQVAEVMKTEFDYGENDINPGSSANLFEMLSHRYQRSGMKRLFETSKENETQNTPPSP